MLTDRQKAAERLLIRMLTLSGVYKPVDGLLIRATACLYVEMVALQKFCNQYGTTYVVVNKSGEEYTKHRPEHQQLQENRTKLLQMLKEMGATPAARKRVASAEVSADPLTELLEMK